MAFFGARFLCHLVAGVAECAFRNGAIHFDGVGEVGGLFGCSEDVVEVVVKRLVGKQLLVVGKVVERVVGRNQAHVRLEVAVETFLAVFRGVDVEAVGVSLSLP